ncbi:hypothetical protein [Thermostichus vulcanus]|uniref:Uncharacterized protein n=1 Tax=Thermostichus vulcanus str. 'Rupite' TaxID=2813851 RepID=A0ABT0C8A7_THEVL|nr:hypothetical protein [Thermostichus vulcanus]MCJ2541984.1 hypothetical protein [Thermostichus vulcanus str. 'Rupite']
MESDPAKRLTYEEGTLEILSLLPIHERYRRLLERIVEVATEEMDVRDGQLWIHYLESRRPPERVGV